MATFFNFAQHKQASILMGTVILLGITGCSSILDKHVTYESVAPEHFPVLVGVGYAPISEQPGETTAIKTLNAMYASKVMAYQELSEQLYGLQLGANGSVQSMIAREQVTQTQVNGVIQGAKVVQSYPVGDNLYATELSLDTRRLEDLRVIVTQPKRIKEVKYY